MQQKRDLLQDGLCVLRDVVRRRSGVVPPACPVGVQVDVELAGENSQVADLQYGGSSRKRDGVRGPVGDVCGQPLARVGHDRVDVPSLAFQPKGSHSTRLADAAVVSVGLRVVRLHLPVVCGARASRGAATQP